MKEKIGTGNFELDEIATASFRASAEADEIAQRLKDTFGFGSFNIVARLAIAYSLSISDPPSYVKAEGGRTIKGDTLFGTGPDLATWVSLLIEYESKYPEDILELQKWVRNHWVRGVNLLYQLLKEVDGDNHKFWRLIAKKVLPQTALVESGGYLFDETPKAVSVPIGEIAKDSITGQSVVWSINVPGASPHAAFMGGVGSGKTRTAAFMLRSIRRQVNVPLVAFDFKGDMVNDQNMLDKVYNAELIAPPHRSIPLDVLAITDHSDTGVKLAAQRLRDSLTTLKGSGFGALQKGLFGDAAEQALRRHIPCRLSDVRDALKQVYKNQGRREDGAITTLEDICRFNLFEPAYKPEEFFSRSWIIHLSADLPELIKISIVTLLTDALDRYLNSLPDAPLDESGNRALRTICLIDEAHRVLGNKLPGLSGLVRQSRSKGGLIMLISQGPDDFSGEEDEFLNEMGLVVAFRTNADARSVRRIFGQGANLAVLEVGEAWVKLSQTPAPKRVIVWR